jgi:hypothetical protein
MQRGIRRRYYSYDSSVITVDKSTIGYIGGEVERESPSGGRSRIRQKSVAENISLSALEAKATIWRSISQPAAGLN